MAEQGSMLKEEAVRDASPTYWVETETASAEHVPPGYKRTEVGVIPEDWGVSSVGEEFITQLGKMLDSSKSVGIPKPYIGNRAVQWGKINLEEIATVLLTPSDLQRFRLEKGDLLVCEGGEVGRAAIWKASIDECYYQKALHRLRPKKNYSIALMLYLLQHWTSSGYLADYVTQTSIAHLPKEKLEKVPLPVPHLSEQRAIATALSDADALIESLDRLIAKKRAIKQAAMQQLLTGQTRLPGFTGEWETKRLGEHATFLKTGTNSRSELSDAGSVAYLHYGDIHVGARVTLNPNLVTVPRIEASKVRHLDKLAPGDLVFVDASEDLEGVGKSVEIAAVPEGGMVAGLHGIAARFDKAVLADGFKAYLQFCPAFIGALRRLAAGTKVLATNRQHIASVEMKLPEVSEQQAIATVLSDMDTEIEALERRRDKARQIKQGMMQQLLTGRVRLL